MFVRMHKLLVEKKLPDSLHEFAFAMSECVRRGGLPEYIVIVLLESIGQLLKEVGTLLFTSEIINLTEGRYAR